MCDFVFWEISQPQLTSQEQMDNPVQGNPAQVQRPRRRYRRRRCYRRRRYFNKNHLIKLADGTRRLTGYKSKRKHFRWRPNPGHANLGREIRVDPQLSAIIGVERASRPQITSRLWVYIKNNNLQNPENGRFFRPNRELATVIGTEGENIDSFQMMKWVKQHTLPD